MLEYVVDVWFVITPGTIVEVDEVIESWVLTIKPVDVVVLFKTVKFDVELTSLPLVDRLFIYRDVDSDL